jgi:predicted GNAT family N-acyltransferase
VGADQIFASEAAEIGDKKALLEFSRLAQSERRAKSDSLGRLGCSGERRGLSDARKIKNAAARRPKTGRWSG